MAYAQVLYKKITGWDCPKRGEPSVKELTHEQKMLDMKARFIVSEHLSHSRLAINRVYLN
jgi:hypothetical protein